jgi:4-diphosphocytidyl-2-C-methyl-D-erythritol kinase
MVNCQLSIRTPAKINVGLRVLSKRRDGYHNIETIFYPVRIYDEIIIDIRKGKRNIITVESDCDRIPKGKDNICYRAADLFLKKFNVEGVSVGMNIKKIIPVGAGLGGGSSDGAAVLMILARHFQRKGIKTLAQELGSDVAYFLNYQLGIRNYQLCAAYATGRGEKLRPMPTFKIPYPILIVYPGINVSTKWAYSRVEKLKSRKVKRLTRIKAFAEKDVHFFENEFEEIVFRKYPEIGKIKEKMLNEAAVFASMSGSGSVVYGVFRKFKEMRRCEKYFKRKGYGVFRG